jgi:hypothetical protein
MIRATLCPPDKGGVSEANGGFAFLALPTEPPAPPAYARVTAPLSGGQTPS